MSYDARLTEFITTLNIRITPKSVLYINKILYSNVRTLRSRLIVSFTYFKLADQHAYSPMHDKQGPVNQGSNPISF